MKAEGAINCRANCSLTVETYFNMGKSFKYLKCHTCNWTNFKDAQEHHIIDKKRRIRAKSL